MKINDNNNYVDLLINAQISGTQFICEQYQSVIQPLLIKVDLPQKCDVVLVDIYPKMNFQLLSLTRLNNPLDYQAVMSIVRTQFEHFISMKTIICNGIDEAESKYNQYSEYGIFKAACKFASCKSTDEKKRYPTYFDKEMVKKAKEIVKSNNENIRNRALSLWKWKETDDKGNLKATNKLIPEYWHGYDWRGLSGKIGEEELYLEVYPFYSWFVHSGPNSSFAGTPEQIGRLFYFAHAMAAHLFIEATKLVVDLFGLSSKIADYSQFLTKLRVAPKYMSRHAALMKIKEDNPDRSDDVDEAVKMLEQQLREEEPE